VDAFMKMSLQIAVSHHFLHFLMDPATSRCLALFPRLQGRELN
jgi:hypothetical protein